MKGLKSLLIVITIFLLGSCSDKELTCTNNCKFPRVMTDRQTCDCICSPTWDNLVNAGNMYCARSGSFVAYLPKENHLDTFSLFVERVFLNDEENRVHEFMYRERASPLFLTGFTYKELVSGDSLSVDMLPPLDFEFSFVSGRDNIFSSSPYRLRFEAFIPDGWDKGDIMHATVHYWTLADNPVRPSVEFDMIKVTEDVE